MALSNSKLNEHLTNTLMQIMIEDPTDVYDNFELISSIVKSKQSDIASKPEVNKLQLERRSQTTSRVLASFKKAPSESEPALEVQCPQLISEFNLLEWANVSFNKSSIYQLNNSIQKLAETLSPDAKRIRFFGIIYTLSSPYYIVETISLADIEEVDENIREGTNGVNKYTYYVSQTVNLVPTEWNILPPVTMDQITSARKFKRFLSGDINAKVPSYPPFSGSEKNYLRALIAEIVGSTSISPVGIYEIDEESDVPAIKLADSTEQVFKSASDLQQPEFWKHHEFKPNLIGRVTAVPQKENNDENEISAEIELPTPLEDITPSDWTFRIFQGDNDLVVAKNISWPGAVTVASRNKVLNVYFGYGVRHNNKRMEPLQPPNMEVEFELSQDSAGLLINEDVLIDPNPVELDLETANEDGDDDQNEDGIEE